MSAPQDPSALTQAPVSKSEYVFQRLRQELRDGTIAPGSQIRQIEIGERYGVSATPVREALRRLEADGLIIYSPHRGATVTDMAPHDLQDLYHFRITVESLCARLAVERGTEDDFAALRRLHDKLTALGDTGDAALLSQTNREFHLAIMRVGSAYIADTIMRPVWEKAIPASESLWDDPAFVRHCLDQHGAILDALDARDADLASSRMSDHIEGARQKRLVRNKNNPSPSAPVTRRKQA
ncbi:GntR family transcriptional regulator [Acrocarpospora pleiomorpha]|uniref:GntR family transcriptional regulator n=1 Tax=Acrocarpospora pleiomorpha TaxID=90975 RepID=A0A5M3XJ66_9ACTN|nr:GntR family transcriptional regulator [Acrocarpospora pleiomorpha]GES20716.1 GntR family transcriptional regulator [Acrocarpospora pleiomorpha]